MGMLKYDQSQSRTVAALLIILVIAVGFIITRVKRTATPIQATQAVQSDQTTTGIVQSVSSTYVTSRNPFVRPPFMITKKNDAQSGALTDSGLSLPQIDKFGQRIPGVSLSPMHIEIKPKDTRTRRAGSPAVISEQIPMPSFILLATVTGKNGMCAIIKTDGSETKVVQIGDVLKDGFRLKSLNETHAILTDGRNVIIAKRPQS